VGRNRLPFQIHLTPPPDLQVTYLSTPDNAFSGQTIPISWTVKNGGTGQTEVSEWSDAIYLSQDSIFSIQADNKLASFKHFGSLAPDNGYQTSQTIVLPQQIYGMYFLFIITDVENQVYEHAWEKNNTRYHKIQITLTPPPDLVVTHVTIPGTGKSGHEITVGWQVQNQGPGAAFENSWNDRVFLSSSQQFHADSAMVLGTFSHSGQLLPDSSYQAQHVLKLPHGIAGSFYIFVKTDWNNQVFEHLFEDNNVKRSDGSIQIDLSPWPDLQVTKIETSQEAIAGSEIGISWTVKNAGRAVAAALWKDRIYISSHPVWKVDAVRQLSEISNSTALDTAKAYTKTSTIILPADISGICYLYVFTNADNSVYEHIDEGNNISRSDSIVIQPYPPVDLAITNIVVPDSGWSGQNIRVAWTVTNAGAARTLVSDWHDGVYLSGDSLLDMKNDPLLKRVRRTASLAAGESYAREEDITLPNGIAGAFYLFVVADIDDRVKDADTANDFQRAAITIYPSQSPDLTIDLLEILIESNAGQPILVRWRVKNIGTGATPNTTWYDAIYLSTDSRLDQTDLKLGSLARQAVVMPGTAYSESLMVEIPTYASGAYFVIIKTDSKGDIYENGSEANNILSRLINFVLPPPGDLIVTNITNPASAIPGEVVVISWTIKNIGQNSAVGWIYDGVYVSPDTNWQATDPLVGVNRRYINLAPGMSQSFSHTISLAKAFAFDNEGNITDQLPGIAPGLYHVIVRTNIRNNIRESDLNNNALASKQLMYVTIPILHLGITERGTLAPKQMKYYRVEVGEKLNLQINFSSDVKEASNGVYVAFDRVPSLADFDYCHPIPLAADQRVLIPSTFKGTYYILIYAEKLPASSPTENFSILAEAVPFSIFSITPARGGQGGRVTGKILGAGFEQPIEVFLRDSLGTLTSGEVRELTTSTEMVVRWDLRDLSLGIYDVVIKKADSLTVVLPKSFVVEPQITDHIFTDVQGPDVLPGGRNAVYEIFVTNANNVDADYIFLSIVLPAYQKFSVITTDFFGRPIPQEILNLLKNPSAARRIGDIVILVCCAKDVPPGKTLHATLILYNISGPAHSSYPYFIKAYALSLEEFFWRELVWLYAIREQLLNADPAKVPKELKDLIQSEEIAGQYTVLLKESGFISEGPILTSTMPLSYSPAPGLDLIVPEYINCETFVNALSVYIDNVFLVGDLANLAFDIAITGVAPPFGLILVAADLGYLFYDSYKLNCSFKECPDWVYDQNIENVIEISRLILSLVHGDLFELTMHGIAYIEKNLVSLGCEEIVYAYDPNQIVGPTGFGNEKWIAIHQNLYYQIHFENDSTLASAPAQSVTIIHQLDSTVDARSFRLGNFGFGNFSYSIPVNRSFYADRLDIIDSLGLFVDVNFGIDITNNEAFWRFKSIDPLTGQLPTNPYLGFLLINDRLGRGQGFVSYSVRPKVDTKTRDIIHAKAKIIFDQNEPIETPQIFNTIDAVAPCSRVKEFQTAKIDTSLFSVRWSGWDDIHGSGINRFSLYVAEDDKPFRLYQTGIQDTALYFSGEMGHDYQFFSIAIDNAGNVEPIKAVGEAKVHTTVKENDQVSLPTKFALHQNYPNPFNPITTIKYELPKATWVELVIYNILGQKVKELVNEHQDPGVYSINWDGRSQEGVIVASGIYLYMIRTPQLSQTKKMIILK